MNDDFKILLTGMFLGIAIMVIGIAVYGAGVERGKASIHCEVLQ